MSPTVTIDISAAELRDLQQLILICEAVTVYLRGEAVKRRQMELTNTLIAVVARAEFAGEHT